MEIKEVHYAHPDLQKLVAKLDEFFVEAWGQEVSDSYQSFHMLSKMAYACVGYEQEAVGCGCFKVMDSQTVEIKRMYIQPQWRRHGFATDILNHLENVARQRGYRYCVLETGKDMVDNILFYENNGYHVIENYGDFINDDICICMLKDLNSN